MAEFERFEFDRSRGVVWVCDIANSSKYLNDNKTVDDLESFIPRLYWTSAMIVEAAGGRFIKWTGDGFLAWFETPLHRQLGERAAAVLDAAWHLTFLVNVTQLGLDPQRKFRIRHGVTYELDALLTRIAYPGGYESLELAGCAVVLAFRLSGISSEFPSIVTQKELLDASSNHRSAAREFRKWNVTTQDKLKYFKGERWGTTAIYVSSTRPVQRSSSARRVARQVKNAVRKAEGESKGNQAGIEFALRFMTRMKSGPEWCQEVLDRHTSFLRDQMLEPLRRVIPLIERAIMDGGSNSA
jgi:class 3 adenylate cyclase